MPISIYIERNLSIFTTIHVPILLYVVLLREAGDLHPQFPILRSSTY